MSPAARVLWVALLWLAASLGAGGAAYASGASPYLPLNLSPDIERKVEHVMILAGVPVMSRPIPVEKILRALPRARRINPALCAEVEHYLNRYFGRMGVTHAAGEAALAKHSTTTLPNQHGERADSSWDASASAFYRPFDYLLVTAGAAGYGGTDGRVTPTGSLVSVGGEYAQLDFGYRDHWFSPLTDSSALISTEAPTMPSATLSNSRPISFLGVQYEVFVARMSYTDQIVWRQGLTAGYPRLTGIHFELEPLTGWAIAGNGLWQFGGGARPAGIGAFFHNLLHVAAVTTAPGSSPFDTRFSNRDLSISSSYSFPVPHPLAAYVEYASRDTLHGNPFRFHQTQLSAGLHMPQIFKRFDLTIEAAEWQNSWYTDFVWLEGMTVDSIVIGNWGADWRSFADAVGAQTVMTRLAWSLRSGDSIDLRWRTLQNQSYSAALGFPDVHYRRAEMVSAEYAQPRNGYTRGLSLDLGRDVYGKSFARLGAFARFDGGNQDHVADQTEGDEAEAADLQDEIEDSARSMRLERFVDAGISGGRLGLDLGGFSADQESAALQYRNVLSPHLGIGVRRAVGDHSDFGVRAEIDEFHGAMLALRLIDYRYRFGRHFALSAFGGAARYQGPTPAVGYYGGAGLQWRDLLPHWDLSLDMRFFDHVQRDKLRPSDPQNGDPVEWYTMRAPSLYISRRF